MRARGWVMAAILGLSTAAGAQRKAPKAPASTEPKPTPVDLKPFRDKLLVLQDANGGTYVALSEAKEYRVWYGTGKVLYEQITRGRSKDGAAWSIATWAPRIGETRPAALSFKKDGTYFKYCDGKDDAVLTLVTGDKANAILANHSLVTPALVRRPHLFARDDAGVYYYIDRLDADHGGKGYRVFVGKKGAMKQLALTDVASDSAGQVFSTKTGDLRLTRLHDVEHSTRWVKGGKKTELIDLDLDVNSPIIFRDLGVYQFTGTLCDNI